MAWTKQNKDEIEELTSLLDSYGAGDEFDTIYRWYVMDDSDGVFRLLYAISKVRVNATRKANIIAFLTSLKSWLDKDKMSRDIVGVFLKNYSPTLV